MKEKRRIEEGGDKTSSSKSLFSLQEITLSPDRMRELLSMCVDKDRN